LKKNSIKLRFQINKSLHSPDVIDWDVAQERIPYELAHERMKTHAAAIAAGDARELIWLLEHPPLYTAGTSANPNDLITPDRFEVHQTGRGGQYTYHGPGQRVAYAMLDLRKRGRDVSAFVRGLEQWIIDTLAVFDVTAERRCKWVSFHGISINVDPDLSHFSGIVPCGIQEHGVASLASLGKDVSLEDLDTALKSCFETIFGPTISQ